MARQLAPVRQRSWSRLFRAASHPSASKLPPMTNMQIKEPAKRLSTQLLLTARHIPFLLQEL
ncbi:hypothetical protein BFW88_11200 [Pseudomonas fluorescens]|nr:hypothetical protein BFW88_11200 [Pseudomonas fluorescens]OPB11404.1 hypothetical protein BFW92_11165 [Pseudomonas fluorescens]OPB22770.1 hypothetical protein BFW93_11195 [Pseudomonas fluorescens]